MGGDLVRLLAYMLASMVVLALVIVLSADYVVDARRDGLRRWVLRC